MPILDIPRRLSFVSPAWGGVLLCLTGCASQAPVAPPRIAVQQSGVLQRMYMNQRLHEEAPAETAPDEEAPAETAPAEQSTVKEAVEPEQVESVLEVEAQPQERAAEESLAPASDGPKAGESAHTAPASDEPKAGESATNAPVAPRASDYVERDPRAAVFEAREQERMRSAP